MKYKMDQVELKIEGTDRYGLIAVDTYLIDALRRLGADIPDECGRRGECDMCAVKVLSGGELLSAPTSAETEQLGEQRLKDGERLSCQAKLEKPGEIIVMITQKNEENKPKTEEETADEYRKKFEDLPLEKKVASLLELEAITLGETFSFVLNSPYAIFGKVMDVMAEFGLKLEQRDKEAKRPEEHKENGSGAESKTEAQEPADEEIVNAEEAKSENGENTQ